MIRPLAATALLLVAHCASATEQSLETVDVAVAHLPDHTSWRVRYRLEAPADQLRFIDDFGLRRHDRWRIETRGFHLVARDGNEFIERKDGKPFREVTARFATDTAKLDKKYPLDKRFTDGSEWLCTLHLYAAPLRRGMQNRQATFRLRLVPAAEESIVLDGQRHADAVTWQDPQVDRGAFVYFGAIAPIETPDVIAIVDPGLPAYLEQQFDDLLPRLFAYYHERTGYALRKRPVILITYDPKDDGNPGDSGEVLPDVIAFDFRSRKFWNSESAANRRMSFHLLAHEAAHLWNGNRFESVEGDAAPWMHEGGADAFAWAAARSFGVLDDEGLRGLVELNLNRCLNKLAPLGMSLQDAFKRGVYELAYSCGSVMNFVVDARLRERGGLFTYWRALFAIAEKSGDQYSVDQYFSTLAALDAGSALTGSLRELWSRVGADPETTLRATLTAAGIAITPGAVPPEFERIYERNAMSALVAEDCEGAYSLRNWDDRFEVLGLPQCHVLKNRKVTVVGLAGEKVTDPARLYAAVAKRCAEHADVVAQLADSDQTLSLHCSAPLPAIAPYLAITSWPH